MKQRKNTVVKKATDSKLKQLKSTYKTNNLVVNAVERHVATREQTSFRATNVIHPSEICKADVCHRKIYYTLTDTRKDTVTESAVSFQLERVFAEGNDIHTKWQNWLWEMGKLYGEWACILCGAAWYGRSPERCISCGERRGLRYKEVPVSDQKYLISGHADGLIDEGLIEIKSVGVGTLRFEAPGFFDKLESGEWTLQETWNAIKRPFPTHIRQGMLYLHCKGSAVYDKMIFIYECKWNQAVKEFVVGYNEEIIAPILDACLDIKYAVEKRKPVDRPDWASPEARECKSCPYNSTCYGTDKKASKLFVKGTRSSLG